MPDAAAVPFSQRAIQIIITQYHKARHFVVAVFVVSAMAILIYPLQSWMLDFLLGLNITLSLILLLTTIYVDRPIDLAVFPSLLLVFTLFRLVLNIASTRLILSRAPVDGASAAGDIIQTFGVFVGGNNLAIGLTIFIIIVVIQFVVITKGATRIAEVAARFTLDAMPGQQMAIDADLNAGLIDEREAKQRREELRQVTDFYGNMDGASKFVRGDAVAGIIITIVNIVAGLIIGTMMSEPAMDLATAGQVFTTLTIGDGLASQVPALLTSIAAGLLVTRSSKRANFGEDMMQQLFGQRRSLFMAGGMLGMLGLISLAGIVPFPSFPLLVLSGGCWAGWYSMIRQTAVQEEEKKEQAVQKAQDAQSQPAEKPESYLHIDPMELEVGYSLVPLVDVSQSSHGGGGLLQRVQMIRQQMAQEMGLIVPPIRIRDNIQLAPNEYVIKIQGNPVARGTAESDRFLAMDSGMATAQVEGIETVEPAFGLPAVWITEGTRDYAESVGYTVVDAETVVATHLTEVIKSKAYELLTREEVRKLLDSVREYAPNLVQEVVPDLLTLSDVQKVLQNLLRERLSIRNLPAILETLGDIGRRTKDTDILTEYVRSSLARWICNEIQEDGQIFVLTMDPRLEDGIAQHVQRTEAGSFLSLRPSQVQGILEAVQTQLGPLLQAGHLPILLTSPSIRMHVKRMTESQIPQLIVLSTTEILPEYGVESVGMVTAEL